MYTVYILQSEKDSRTYVGYTKDFTNRLKMHNSGQVKATKYRFPLRVLFTEQIKDEHEAKKRELYWKSGAGRRKLKEFFKSQYSNIRDLS